MKKCLSSAVLILAFGLTPAFAEQAVMRLTMADAVKMAVEKNLDVRAELYNPAQQEAEYRKSRGIYDPNLQLQANYSDSTATSSFLLDPPSRQASRTTLLNAGLSQLFFTGATATLGFNNTYTRSNASTIGLTSYWQSSLGVTLNQPLLKNLGREATELAIDVARLGKEAALEQFSTKLIATIAQVRSEYYKLYSLREALEVKKVSLELARKILAETQARVKAGVMPAMEILNAEFGVASREKDMIDAERAVSDQVDVLRQLIQSDMAQRIETVEVPSKERYEAVEQDEIKRALANRPELKALKRNLEIAELQARVSGNRTLPDLSLNASYATAGLASTYTKDMNRLGSNDYPTWAVGLTFSLPLGNRAAENDYRKNRLKVEQALVQLKNQEELIVNEIRAAIRSMNANYKQLEVADRGRAFAEERFKAFVRKAEVGLATNKDVLDVENDLVTAKNNQIQAAVSYANAITALWKASGELLEKEHIKLVGQQEADALYGSVK